MFYGLRLYEQTADKEKGGALTSASALNYSR